ncbi:hypothetical protein [uncultured Lactobacillus sp.]|uniref:hypothetical protein n=1 Tax=uncultured Lactobacillus sp. TaxID=153152 RepID=UPI002665C6F8|nr:hypothetical protein [uncultured Lactobacillus sp.]
MDEKRASWTKGYYSYEKDVDLAKLEAKFKEVFNDLALELPESVGGKRPLRSTRHSSNRGW